MAWFTAVKTAENALPVKIDPVPFPVIFLQRRKGPEVRRGVVGLSRDGAAEVACRARRAAEVACRAAEVASRARRAAFERAIAAAGKNRCKFRQAGGRGSVVVSSRMVKIRPFCHLLD
jgi:hypothetical protein